MPPTNVLVATPSAINRARAAKLIAAVPGYEVIATTADLSATFNCAEISAPGFVVIGEEFCRLDEFSVMQALFDALGTRWILLEAGNGRVRGGAVRVGASSSARPRIDLSMTPEQIGVQMQAVPPAIRPDRKRAMSTAPQKSAAFFEKSVAFDKLVVIGSSIGGIDALLTLLADFPEDCPPTAIVQHTGRGFSDSLVQLLGRRCKPTVVAGQEGLILRQGMVCVAGGTAGHMTLAPGACCVVRFAPARRCPATALRLTCYSDRFCPWHPKWSAPF